MHPHHTKPPRDNKDTIESDHWPRSRTAVLRGAPPVLPLFPRCYSRQHHFPPPQSQGQPPLQHRPPSRVCHPAPAPEKSVRARRRRPLPLNSEGGLVVRRLKCERAPLPKCDPLRAELQFPCAENVIRVNGWGPVARITRPGSVPATGFETGAPG